MRQSIILILFISSALTLQAQLIVEEIGTLPDRVANNAVTEGFIGDTPYLFSFGGLDSTKTYKGIHLKSYRVNLNTGKSERIPDLPDTLGKVAAGASRLGNIIYIFGGYHVFADRSELSSNKVHRYDITKNEYLTDGANIPVAIDDHVQTIYQDSLIYLITGWSDKKNVPNVQIYNSNTDSWSVGRSTPDEEVYKSFGASGTIIGHTIYYFGGATSVRGYAIHNQLRIGEINPVDPTDITWSIHTPDTNIDGYRMASTSVKGQPHWIGGSNQTYNYNGIAYNRSGGVPPNNRDLYFDGQGWIQQQVSILPMDLRGIANISDTEKYLAGGMLSDQRVSNKVYKLTWR